VEATTTEIYAEELEGLRWFRRRYPTVRERLQYTRRKARDFDRLSAIARPPPKERRSK